MQPSQALNTRTPAKRRPAAKRAPAIPFPELPIRSSDDPLYWRAAWLQDQAKRQALKDFIAQKAFQRMSRPLRQALFSSEIHLQGDIWKSLKHLVETGGLLYAWLPEGGAQ